MKDTTTTLVLTEALPAAGMRLLEGRAAVRLVILPAPSEGELARALPEADGVVMVMERPALTARLVERAPRLRVACRFGAGYDNIDVAALTRRGIPLATTGGANADAVAEHALYLMLALAKRGPALDRAVKQGGWPRSLGNVELRDRTCALVGYGRIGRAIARRIAGFGMKLIVVDPHAPGATVLAEALPRADFVVLACSLTPETQGLMNAANLERMKPGAFLVNVARGPVVDEPALAAALRQGRLAGAGLDVLDTEPPSAGDPLLARDDVVLTPHVAGHVATAHERVAIACAQAALAGLDGRLDPDLVVNAEVLRP
ncbi:MAG: NAD(P)-dependent oxidoreductase [Betaproteobacteria bacterium]